MFAASFVTRCATRYCEAPVGPICISFLSSRSIMQRNSSSDTSIGVAADVILCDCGERFEGRVGQSADVVNLYGAHFLGAKRMPVARRRRVITDDSERGEPGRGGEPERANQGGQRNHAHVVPKRFVLGQRSPCARDSTHDRPRPRQLRTP